MTPPDDLTQLQSSAPTHLFESDTLPTVPGFQLLAEVGRGGMGVVYRARDTALHRDVAVKMLQDRYPPDGSAAQRFVEESRITSQLQHPGVPPIHQVGALADGRPFLVMKLIKGRTLDSLWKERKTPSDNRGRFVAAFEQICQTVGYAHAHGVIHRDLKPANIMVGAFGEVQVMDWGLSKSLTDTRLADAVPAVEEPPRTAIGAVRDPGSATQAGSVMGTPAFMPPEQAGGEIAKIDVRSDVFSLGAVLCVILTGEMPYVGDSAESVRLMAIRGQLGNAMARLDACGAEAELVALCKRCLSVERDDRPKDANELASAVAGFRSAAEERARQAELDRVRAEEQLRRELAERARDEALRLKSLAEKGQAAEAEARRMVEFDREKLAAFEYGRAIELAHQEWREMNEYHARMRLLVAHGYTGTWEDREFNESRARALLNHTKPQFRGWEWRYVHRLCSYSSLAKLAYGGRDFSDGELEIVRDAKKRVESLTLKGHTGPVCSASFSADGSRVLTSSVDGTAKVWDARAGVELLTLRGHLGGVNTASFSRDGERIVTAGCDNTAKVWDAKTGTEMRALIGHMGRVASASFSVDGYRILTASLDGTAKVWDARGGAELLTLKGHTDRVSFASFSPDGSRIVTSSYDHTARVWDAIAGTERVTLKGHLRFLSFAAFSPDGEQVVTGGREMEPRVWDASTGTELLVLRGHLQRVTSASFSPDGSRLVTGSWDMTAKVWDAKTGAELLTLKEHAGFVRCGSFSPDGTQIVTGGEDQVVKVWDSQPLGSDFFLVEPTAPSRVVHQ